MTEKQTNIEGHGKKNNQKLKPYLVMKYLLHYSDESHAVSAPDIVDYLRKEADIYAERRSIYRDIEDINIAMLIAEKDYSVVEAKNEIDEYAALFIIQTKKAIMCANDVMNMTRYALPQKAYMPQSSFQRMKRKNLWI